LSILSPCGEVIKSVRVAAGRQWGRVALPFLAYSLGFAVRLIPELATPDQLIGFDTVTYYGPLTLAGYVFRPNLGAAGLVIPWLLYAATGDIFLSLKLLGPISNGAASLGVYFASGLVLPRSYSMFAAALYSLSLGGLRTSWDLHRQSLGVGVGLTTLTLAGRLSGRTRPALIPLCLLLPALHEGSGLLSLMALLSLAATMKSERPKRLFIALSAVAPMLVGIATFSFSPFRQEAVSSAVTPTTTSPIDLLSFTFFLHLVMFPLVILGLFSRKAVFIHGWTLGCLALMLTPLVLGLGISTPQRWAILLSPVFAVYAATGALTVRRYVSKITVSAMLISLLLGWSFFFVLPYASLTQPHIYVTALVRDTSHVPASLVENTLPVAVSRQLPQLIDYAESSLSAGSCVGLPFQVFGHTAIMLGLSPTVQYGFQSPPLDDVLSTLRLGGSSQRYTYLRNADMYRGPPEEVSRKLDGECHGFYLIWWSSGRPFVPGLSEVQFSEVFRTQDLAIYRSRE